MYAEKYKNWYIRFEDVSSNCGPSKVVALFWYTLYICMHTTAEKKNIQEKTLPKTFYSKKIYIALAATFAERAK